MCQSSCNIYVCTGCGEKKVGDLELRETCDWREETVCHFGVIHPHEMDDMCGPCMRQREVEAVAVVEMVEQGEKTFRFVGYRKTE